VGEVNAMACRVAIANRTEPLAPTQSVGTQMAALLRRHAVSYRAIRLPKGAIVYHAGDLDRTIYLLEDGTIKVAASTYCGRSCLLDIYQAPSFFGEVSSDVAGRTDIAVARTAVQLRKIPHGDFTTALEREGLMATFVAYLSAKIWEYQQLITEFVTSSAEERLASTLLRLGRKLGRREAGWLCVGERLSCQELAEIVGTTRSRVGFFLGRFRERELLSDGPGSTFKVRERGLVDYLNERF
jgi:CRP/FNR family transcriptional regulator, cyclic AMP receptor protein